VAFTLLAVATFILSNRIIRKHMHQLFLLFFVCRSLLAMYKIFKTVAVGYNLNHAFKEMANEPSIYFDYYRLVLFIIEAVSIPVTLVLIYQMRLTCGVFYTREFDILKSHMKRKPRMSLAINSENNELLSYF